MISHDRTTTRSKWPSSQVCWLIAYVFDVVGCLKTIFVQWYFYYKEFKFKGQTLFPHWNHNCITIGNIYFISICPVIFPIWQNIYIALQTWPNAFAQYSNCFSSTFTCLNVSLCFRLHRVYPYMQGVYFMVTRVYIAEAEIEAVELGFCLIS